MSTPIFYLQFLVNNSSFKRTYLMLLFIVNVTREILCIDANYLSKRNPKGINQCFYLPLHNTNDPQEHKQLFRYVRHTVLIALLHHDSHFSMWNNRELRLSLNVTTENVSDHNTSIFQKYMMTNQS